MACLLAVPRARRFDDTDVRIGLVGLLVTTGLWAVCKTVFFILPDPFREGSYIIGLIFGFATVWAWLYFCSAYTGRTLHQNSTLRRIGAAVFLVVISVKLTNPIHGLYFETTAMTVPFEYLAIEHGLLHWIATGLSYTLAGVGLFMIFELYVQSEYDTRPLALLTGALGLPVALDIIAIGLPTIPNFIYSPLGVAVFSLGTLFIFEQRFLAVRTTVQRNDLTLFVDEKGEIRDYSTAVQAIFPEFDDATGKQLADVLPEAATALNGDEPILERTDSGETHYYLVSGTTLSVGDTTAQVVTFTDVTDRERQRRQLVRQERELDEQTELYRAVIAASFAFVFRIDLDNTFSFVSPSVEEFLGYSPEELQGEPVAVLIPDEDASKQARERLSEVAHGEALQVREFPLETNDGDTIYVDVRLVPIFEPGVPVEQRTADNIVGAQAMAQDATGRRRREGLISVINRVLRHNVRNKLTVINGYAEVLSAELDGDSAAKADKIVDSADRLLDLTESARRIEKSRELSPDLTTMDIVPVITELVDQIEGRYPNVSVTVDTPDTALVESLPRVETALWELLENAAEHGGSEPSIDIEITASAGETRISIHDDGPGIPENEREVLSTGAEQPLVHSQGLGLWLAYWLITNLDGNIEIQEFQTGTTVVVRLPSAAE
jgi:PAS domain S-box-containing protein